MYVNTPHILSCLAFHPSSTWGWDVHSRYHQRVRPGSPMGTAQASLVFQISVEILFISKTEPAWMRIFSRNTCCHHVLVKGSQQKKVFTTQSLVKRAPISTQEPWLLEPIAQEEGLVEVDSSHMEWVTLEQVELGSVACVWDRHRITQRFAWFCSQLQFGMMSYWWIPSHD